MALKDKATRAVFAEKSEREREKESGGRLHRLCIASLRSAASLKLSSRYPGC